jgi:hypothetical protein
MGNLCIFTHSNDEITLDRYCLLSRIDSVKSDYIPVNQNGVSIGLFPAQVERQGQPPGIKKNWR